MPDQWSVTLLNELVAEEFAQQPADVKASFFRMSELLSSHGLEQLREPYVKHLQGRLWEMRLRGKDGIARALYVTAQARRVVVVRIFTKKTQRTPPKEIKLALKRAKEIV